MHVKQGKGGSVNTYPEIAADFHLWLDPKTRPSMGIAQVYDKMGDTSEYENTLWE